MEARKWEPDALVDIFGNPHLVAEVLAGRRPISKGQAKALGKLFRVPGSFRARDKKTAPETGRGRVDLRLPGSGAVRPRRARIRRRRMAKTRFASFLQARVLSRQGGNASKL